MVSDCVLLCCAVYVQERELDYRSLFIHGGVAQGVARLDGHFIDCNKMFTKLTGYMNYLATCSSHSPVRLTFSIDTSIHHRHYSSGVTLPRRA
jgi:hypothetical protein